MRNTSYRLLGILTVIFAFLLFNGCKKAQDKAVQVPENINKHPLENLFFATADSVPATVKKVAAYLLKRSDKSEIASSVIDGIGFPAWDKAVIIEARASKTAIGVRAAPLDTNYLFVPIVPQGTEEVEGAFVCKIVGDSVSVLLLNEKNYKEYGFDASKPRNAHHLVSLMMFLQAKTFGTECFVLNDGRLFANNGASVDSTGKQFIYIGNNAASSNRQNKTLFAADYIIETTICYYSNNTNRVSSKGAIAASVLVPCIKTYEWIPTGGSSSGSYDPGMGPGGGSGGGGTSSTASISITQYFQQTLGLTSSQLIILNAFPQLSEECFNYLQIPDGQLTYEEQKKLVTSHILNLKTSPLYLEYCESVSVQNAQSQGKYYPWFRYNTLFNANSALANNIQNLKMDAQQAYYLLNNNSDNQAVHQLLQSNGYSEYSIRRVMLAFEDWRNGKLFSLSVNPLVKLKNIIDNLNDPCLKAAKNKLTNALLDNYIVNLYYDTYSSKEVNIKFQEDINLKFSNGTYKIADSYPDVATQTWVITINPLFFNGNQVNKITQEYAAQVIMHEIVHSFLVLYKEQYGINSLAEFDTHMEMFKNWVVRMRDALKNAFPSLTTQEATAFALSGIDDVLEQEYGTNGNMISYSEKMNEFAEKNYGITLPQADQILNDYIYGTKGTKCF